MPHPNSKSGRTKRLPILPLTSKLAKNKETIFGVPIKNVHNQLTQAWHNDSRSIRIYRIWGPKPRFIAKVLTKFNDQQILEIIPRKGGLAFFEIGFFESGFRNRELKDLSLRGHGIGSKALRTHLAQKRTHPAAHSTDKQYSRKKSAIKMFLRNGYKIAPPSKKRVMEALHVKTEAGLLKKLEDLPEDLDLGIYFERPLRQGKHKEKHTF